MLIAAVEPFLFDHEPASPPGTAGIGRRGDGGGGVFFPFPFAPSCSRDASRCAAVKTSVFERPRFGLTGVDVNAGAADRAAESDWRVDAEGPCTTSEAAAFRLWTCCGAARGRYDCDLERPRPVEPDVPVPLPPSCASMRPSSSGTRLARSFSLPFAFTLRLARLGARCIPRSRGRASRAGACDARSTSVSASVTSGEPGIGESGCPCAHAGEAPRG